MSVTLYRVRRPDGTLIDKPPSSDKALAAASAWDELPKEMRTRTQLAMTKGAAGPRLLWTLADLGYTIEAVEYVEQAAQGRKVELPKVREFLLIAKDRWFSESSRKILDAALAELDAAEGRK